MAKKIMIEGMMCGHCVAHVREALEGIGAANIEVSLDGGYAVCDTDKSNDELKNLIEDEGYDVTDIQ
ncbi:MAG: heavy-metal-associated domain-containing protein [Oscillospiraceae bacterium]|nr:heavy-metal-associated domain-containing protein [Oscillospiraceae bacterium]